MSNFEQMMNSGGTHRRPYEDKHLRWAWIVVLAALALFVGTSIFLCADFFA